MKDQINKALKAGILMTLRLKKQKFSDRSTAIVNLQERGYEADYIMDKNGFQCVQDKVSYSPDHIEVIEAHIIGKEQSSLPCYLISALSEINTGRKGILMTSFGSVKENRGDSSGTGMFRLGKRINQLINN